MKYPSKSSLSVFVVLLLTFVFIFFAAQLSAQDFPPEPDTGFELEGNADHDGDGDYDWENAPYPPAALLADPHSKAETDPTTFRPDGKFDDPAGWSIVPGIVGPDQNELTNTMAWAIPPGELDGKPDDFWLIMGMERTKKEGTFFLDFEYNQLQWDGTTGGPNRSEGDIVVGFELKGNPIDRQADLSVLIIQFFTSGQPSLCEVTPGNGNSLERVEMGSDPCPAYGDSGWYYRFLADGGILASSGLGQATMNEEAFAPPWTSYNAKGGTREMIGPFEFAEAAINLTELGVEPKCETFSSVHAKTRSSLEVGSDLKDVSAAVPLSTNCRVDGHKFLDIDGDGLWGPDEPPLEGWQIELSGEKSGGRTAYTDEKGYYEFEYLADDRYTISEVCDEGFVQTFPGMTDFDNCGQETYTVDIDIRNREVNDLDFGNGNPAIEVEKSCPADVFAGDTVGVKITVTNSGGVNLYDVTVTDAMIGLNETIGILEPGDFREFLGSYLAPNGDDDGNGNGPPPVDEHLVFLPVLMNGSLSSVLNARDPITNTAVVEAQYAAVTVSDSDQCVVEVHKLDVEKDAQTTFDRKYLWEIEKVVDPEGPILLFPGQTVPLSYGVTVDLATPSTVDENWAVSGTIAINNPAPMDAELTAVIDAISGVGPANVDCGLAPWIVPAEGSLVCTYGPTDLPNGNARTNTATATLLNNNGNTTNFVGTADVVFDEPDNVRDETVEVHDSFGGLLGTVSADEAPKVFIYERTLGPIPEEECDPVELWLDNIAWLIGADTGDLDLEAEANVPYFCLSTVTVGSEDLPTLNGNDWDYNDIVVDVKPVLTYSEDGFNDLEAVSFTVEQEAKISLFTHAFGFRPAFACDGTYQLTVGGVTETGDYQVGDSIELIDDSGSPAQLVELSIEFDVVPGECPLDLNQPEFDLINQFHGEGLFFGPWVRVNNSFNNTTYTIEPGDARLLNVPENWQWPNEGVAIWFEYGGVFEPVPPTPGPVFTPLWWQTRL